MKTIEELKLELEKIQFNTSISIVQNLIYSILYNMIIDTSKNQITNNMINIMNNCFHIISIPEFNKRDFNYIKKKLIEAGWVYKQF